MMRLFSIFVVLVSADVFPFSQVIDLVEFRAEDDDDCYELQNILSDPHVMVSYETNLISQYGIHRTNQFPVSA